VSWNRKCTHLNSISTDTNGDGTSTGGGRSSFLGTGPLCAKNAPKDGVGFHSLRDHGGSLLDFSGVEFSTDTVGNFQSELWTLRLETVIHVQIRKALQVSQDGRSRTRLLDFSFQGVAG
jgi:hypothetical protein